MVWPGQPLIPSGIGKADMCEELQVRKPASRRCRKGLGLLDASGTRRIGSGSRVIDRAGLRQKPQVSDSDGIGKEPPCQAGNGGVYFLLGVEMFRKNTNIQSGLPSCCM